MLKLMMVLLAVVCSKGQLTIDLLQKNKYGNETILSTTCNKDTQIDFMFSANSKVVCTGSSCTTSGLQASTMKFMDINGNDLQLTLTEALIATASDLVVSGLVVNQSIVFIFTTSGASHTVIAVIPVVFNSSPNGAVIDANYLSNGKFANFLVSASKQTLDLTAFSYLN
jgi:hypothetical protein